MIERTSWKSTAPHGWAMLAALATLALVASTWFGAAAPVAAQGNGSVDVAIFTHENGQPAYDACYVLVGYSNEGCDENGDGNVMFSDVPFGTYTVHQTADLGPGRYVSDFTIQVRGNINSAGFESFSATILSAGGSSAGGSSSSGAIDISLITREPVNGRLLTGTCYVLVGYSNEGCDENGDGQVTFDDVPFGTYTVTQTRVPAGYPTINDYVITVDPVQGVPGGRPVGGPLGFIVKQAPEQNDPNTRNLSVILIDASTGEKVVADVCVELVGGSNVGCDEDLRDGQIDFLDVSTGKPYELRFSNLPAGWQVRADGQLSSVSIDPQADTPANVFVPVLLTGTESGSTGPSSTSSSSGSSSDMRPMQISAMACSTADPSAIQAGRNADDGTCYWDIGATFTVSTEDGTYIGSCTLAGDRNAEIRIVGNVNCRVPVPIGVKVIVTEDVSTITPGTAPQENPLSYTWPTNSQALASYMGVSFLNVPNGGGASNGTGGSLVTSSSSSTIEATVLMTFRGCPEGFFPDVDDPFTDCTIPLDAPDASVAGEWGVGQSLVPISGLERRYDGAYIFYASSDHGYFLHLMGLEPVLRDDFLIYGVDDQDGSSYITLLDNGGTHEIFVFYYYYP